MTTTPTPCHPDGARPLYKENSANSQIMKILIQTIVNVTTPVFPVLPSR